jgi:hypothetical protein
MERWYQLHQTGYAEVLPKGDEQNEVKKYHDLGIA